MSQPTEREIEKAKNILFCIRDFTDFPIMQDLEKQIASALAERNEEIEKLKGDKRLLGKEVDDVSRENVALSEKIESLKSELSKSHEIIESMKSEYLCIKHDKSACPECAAEFRVLESKFSKSEEKVGELLGRCLSETGDNFVLRNQIKILNSTIPKVEEENKALSSRLSDYEGMDTAFKNHQIRTRELEKANEDLCARVRELEKALDRIRTIDSPTFNGERVTTINPSAPARWQVIAEEALSPQSRTETDKDKTEAPK